MADDNLFLIFFVCFFLLLISPIWNMKSPEQNINLKIKVFNLLITFSSICSNYKIESEAAE